MVKSRLCLLFLLGLIPCTLTCFSQIIITSDRATIVPTKQNSHLAHVTYIDNVHVQINTGITLKTSKLRALINPTAKNRQLLGLKAFGNVHVQTPSVCLRAQSLYLLPGQQRARLVGNIRLLKQPETKRPYRLVTKAQRGELDLKSFSVTLVGSQQDTVSSTITLHR